MSDLSNLLSKICSPRQKNIVAGGAVFKQGDPAENIFQVEQGVVRLIRYTLDGYALTMFKALPGQTFAEAALFAEFYHCSAIADNDSRIICFHKKQLLQSLEKQPAVMLDLVARLSGQVRELRTLLETRSIKAAPERTMHYLQLHANPLTGIYEHTGSFKDLAAELGLAHETFYRTLSTLEKEEQIKRKGRSILVRQVEPIGEKNEY